MTEPTFYRWLLLAWLGLAAVTFVVLLVVPAPYGRYRRSGWGPGIGATWGWVAMELPAVVMMPLLLLLGDHRGPLAWIFLALWELHYLQRTFVFPFRRRGRGEVMPLSVVGMAVFFNLVNGYLNGRWLFHLGPQRGSDWLADPRFLSGVVLFAAGLALNVASDARLRQLRRPGESSYRIPRGGAFRWISCPNYAGEIVEWCGWALLTFSPGGLAFAAWTFANLAPRALAHHRWYRRQFPDYPQRRRALVPYLL